MKKGTLMLIIGVSIAFFGYRYFSKGKAAGTAIIPDVNNTVTKGTMIVPETIASPVAASVITKTISEPKVLQTATYMGPFTPVGNSYYLGHGDKLEGTINDDGTFTINRYMTILSQDPNGRIVNLSDIILD